MGESVGHGVGVGVRAILVSRFFGVWFFRFSIFLEGGPVAGQVFVLVCVRKEAAPLVLVVWR